MLASGRSLRISLHACRRVLARQAEVNAGTNPGLLSSFRQNTVRDTTESNPEGQELLTNTTSRTLAC
jgi:hypothetical protein